MKTKMPQYQYINMDSGWCETYDEYGRWVYRKDLFPDGLASLTSAMAENGHKLGLYILPGIRKDAADDDKVLIKGTNRRLGDLCQEKKDGNGFTGTTYQADDYNDPMVLQYYESQAELFAEWGISFVKIDGCGPGGGGEWQPGGSPDTRRDLELMHKAFSKHNIWMELSWYLDVAYAKDWAATGNGVRIFIDIESYSKKTMTSAHRVFKRISYAAEWANCGYLGAEHGLYIDMDVVTVGMTVDGECIDGLANDDVRLSYITFWALTSSVFCLGADPRKIPDTYLHWYNHPDMLVVHQCGIMAHPVGSGDAWKNRRQVWWKKLPDGRVAVGLFNTSVFPKFLGRHYDVTFDLKDVGLHKAKIKDVWAGMNLGSHKGPFTTNLRPGQCQLLILSPE
ncbi:glycoside hydrolase [Hesseltinella vesiculosa]|uniref:alpha-galactosidase n=1 Tax=Hesseltinella vesiculosa TaxID=101127 RepID=A0A1X2GJM8_9FUNG|nr:glycoside hydrolase [Hesseltinella vesiculosa]